MQKFGGGWSEAKLDCIEEYTKSYLKVLQNQNFVLHYVDAFAGRGKQELKPERDRGATASELAGFFGDQSERNDTQEFIIGSAIRALRASASSVRTFDRFVFIESSEPSCGELRQEVQEQFPQIYDKVEVRCGNANDEIKKYVDSVDWKRTRAIVFLDPFGLEVSWDMVKLLSETKACDVWYLFPLGGVTRMMKKNGQIPESWRSRLGKVFGTDEWEREFYKKQKQVSLFRGENERVSKVSSTKGVIDFIRKRLLTTFSAVSNAGKLTNSKQAPLFALLLGVSNPSLKAQKTALAIANHLVKGLNQPWERRLSSGQKQPGIR